MATTITPNPARPLWESTARRAPRRLGSVFAAPRSTHLVYFPCLFLVTGMLCYLIPTDTMLIAGALVLSVVGAWLLYTTLLTPGPFRFSTLFVLALCFGYGLGTVSTWFSVARSGMDLALFLRRDPVVITRGMGGILVSLAVVLAVGEGFERPVFGEEFRLRLPPQGILFLLAGTLVLVVGYARGAIGFMGSQLGAGSSISTFTAFVTWLLNPLFAFTLLTALNTRGRLLRFGLQLLFLFQFLLLIPTGRRAQLFSIMVAIFTVRLGAFRVRWSVARQIITALVLGSLLYITTLGFFYLRLGGWATGRKEVTFSERISAAVDYFRSTPFSEVQKLYSKNFQSRTFVLGFLAELEDYSTRFTPGYGYDLWMNLDQAIPSALYPSKHRGFTEEALADELFGTSYGDEANSVLTTGAIDFGLLGMIAYPLLFSLLFRTFSELLGEAVPTYVACFLIVQFVSSLIEPEQTVVDYFTAVRNGILFGSMVWAFMSIPTLRLRRDA